ncbi:peptidoglycan DD-metalloendopeptidase family protein [Ideonella sp. BN130291]|uniref:peptidoglycan DD-metalloendopeptidase family protein n=1 Tax=Ideonella sp. BN130291 TaxID=3112940 RepID=UPI002E26BFA4|nr:peptidoglycan DD-metalloendopeptidase family protein [Ideonella sp. BN130291]
MGVQPLRALRIVACLMLAALLAACASPSRRAPVEERSAVVRAPAAAASAPAEPVKPPPPGIENLGKPGYYAVKPGDTMIRIGLETGQNWRDIAKWNNIENPNVIEVGQVLRVVAPGTDPTMASARGVTPPKVETRPLSASAPASAASAPAATASAPPSVGQIVAPLATPREPEDDLNWAWPASGPVVARFDDSGSKGLAIAGKAGDPVYAAADGRVVYAGSGLRGYGNLVIVKHNNTYLTAYAHNQTLLVKEEQVVKRGQKIAEMGSSDAERVQLHFEIRKQGKPIDPAKLLPQR